MNNLLNVSVSLFRNCKDPVPLRNIRLIDFLTKSSPHLTKIVEIIRNTDDKDEIRELKSKLPAITVSGCFEYRKYNRVKSYSNILAIDIDNYDPQKAKEYLKTLPYVTYAGISVSGKGVFALIQISDPKNIGDHFDALKEELSIPLDSACRDVARLRYFSIDLNPYINENASVYIRKKNRQSEPIKMTKINVCDSDDIKFEKILNEINKNAIDITTNRNEWVAIGLYISGRYGEIGRSYFHQISQYHPEYKRSEADHQYNSFLRMNSRISIGSLLKIAKDYGITYKINK